MPKDNDLAGKVAIVTGATTGIGLWTALGLAERGARLVITGRDAGKLADAVTWLKARVPAAEIETERGDFASLNQVRAMGERILAKHPRIGVLVNNAGLMALKRVVTEDGFESTFQINHLAPFLLTGILLPALKAGAPSRIVTVSSRASTYARIAFDDLGGARRFGVMAAYGQSKLANIMMTYGLARRLEGTGVTANCVHPGLVASNFGNKGPISNFVWTIMRPLMLSAEQGARNSLYAATAPEMDGVTGKYLINMKPVRSNPISYDDEAVERLWRESVRMTGAQMAGIAA
jgi:NAD(P)-dependent dehydrogenase (short-subunit alcohol dehydrogenase family)